ncbi:MAG: glycosyltransferase family 39 protein [Devosia sp.]|nr:glycosyltransferase family 39 protein [Devosia sp.]
MSPSASSHGAATVTPRIGGLWTLLLVLLLSGLALLLRLNGLGSQSLWWDEVSSWQQARLDWNGLLAATAADNYPPLHNLLLHLSMLALGDSAFALRLPSALLGALAIPALYWTGSLIAGRPAALIAAGLLSVSSFHLWYSQEARMYALFCLATLLFAGSALQFARRGGLGWGTASVLAGTALFYSHPYGALNWATLLLAVGLWLRAERGCRATWRFGLVQLPALLLFAPWALILMGRARVIAASGFWIPPLSPSTLLEYFEVLLSGPGLLATLLMGLLLAVAPLIAPPRPRVLAAVDRDTPPALSRRAALLLLLGWGLLPAAVAVVISLLTEPVLFTRYLIGSLPALLLLAGMGFSRLPRGALGLAGLLGLAAAAIIGLLHFGLGERDDFRDVAARLAAELEPGDCVVMSPESRIAMNYYNRAGFHCLAVVPRPAEAAFGDLHPQRIFLIETGVDQSANFDLAALGRVVMSEDFGPTRLLLISPR